MHNKSLANPKTVRMQCAVPTFEKFTVQLSAWSTLRAHCFIHRWILPVNPTRRD